MWQVCNFQRSRDECYTRNILVINDEAHHAYRSKPGDEKPRTREEKEDYRAATVWINGLDLERIYTLERMQTVIFRTAISVYDEMKSSTSWQEGGKILIRPELFAVNGMRRKMTI